MIKLNQELRQLCEDVILNQNNDNNQATEALIQYADEVKAKGQDGGKAAEDNSTKMAWRNKSVEERLAHSLINGITDFIDADTEEARLNTTNLLKSLKVL
jgi:5-methyltetrahydrofolate--homocysteine methyltransferase